MTLDDLALAYYSQVKLEAGFNISDIVNINNDLIIAGSNKNLIIIPGSGKASRLPNAPLPTATINNIAIGQNNRLFVCLSNQGVYYTDDLGQNWTLGQAMGLARVVATDGNGRVLITDFVGNGHVSNDNGATWGSQIPFGTGSVNTGFTQVMAYHSELNLFIRFGTGQRINTSIDGVSWTSINQSGMGFSDFVTQKVLGSILYIGDTSGRQYTSVDNGVTLNQILDTFYNGDMGSTGTVQFRAMGVFNNALLGGRNGEIDIGLGDSSSPLLLGINSVTSGNTNNFAMQDDTLWIPTSNEILKSPGNENTLNLALNTITAIDFNNVINSLEVKNDVIYAGSNGARVLIFDFNLGKTNVITTGGSSNVFTIRQAASGRLVFTANDGIRTTDDDFQTDIQKFAGTNLRVVAANSNGVIVVGSTTSATGQVSTDNGESWNPIALGTGITNEVSQQIILFHPQINLFIRLVDQVINTSSDGLTWTPIDQSVLLGSRELLCQAYFDGKLWFGDNNGRVYTSIDNGVTLIEFENTFYNDELPSVVTRFACRSMHVFMNSLFIGHSSTAISRLNIENDSFKPVGIGATGTIADFDINSITSLSTKVMFAEPSGNMFQTARYN